MVKRIRSFSGIDIIFNEFKQRKNCSLGIWITKGARHEPAQFKGIAHFLEHLLFKGTKKYSHKQIKREIEGRGGHINGFTSQEVTCYFVKVLDKNLTLALDVLLDMVTVPCLRKEDIEKERGVILEEVKMYKDMPSSRVNEILNSLLWQKHSLGIDVIGKERMIRKIKRADIDSFLKRSYIPPNIKVVICGKQIPFDIERVVSGRFRGWKKQLSNIPVKKASVAKGFGFSQEVSSFTQSHLSLGFPGFSFSDKRRITLGLIHVILGANMSSRLFESIREDKGLAYEISTGIEKYRDTGAFTVHCGLETKNIPLAFKLILKELDRIKHKKVSARELNRAKEYFIGNMHMALDDPTRAMFYLGESFCLRGKALEVEEIEGIVNSITPQHIKTIAGNVFRFKDLKVAIVTNKKDSFKPGFKKALNKYI
jgi:predicted Zn-dependent peptidase